MKTNRVSVSRVLWMTAAVSAVFGWVPAGSACMPSPAAGPSSQSQKAPAAQINWRTYNRTATEYTFRVEYPADWSVRENGNVVAFLPPGARSGDEAISLVVIDYRKTPPLPVQSTYTTIRTVRVGNEAVEVRRREPAPVSERYFADLRRDGYSAEFRCAVEPAYDDVFDHMLTSFDFTAK